MNRLTTRLLLFVFLGLLSRSSYADVSVEVKVWRVYDFSYYLSIGLTASAPTPITYHRVESPSGKAWVNRGPGNNSSGSWVTNDLSAVLDECNNGLWKLYLNVGDASEELYQFAVSVTDVTSNALGNVEVVYPQDGSSGVPPLPTFHFTGPSNLPSLYLNVDMQTAFLSSAITNWTPTTPLLAGSRTFYVEYSSNNFPGFTFTVATNSTGDNVPGWSARGTLAGYAYSTFGVSAAGTGGHALLAHYSFENGSIFATDYSGNGNNIGSIASSGGGTRYTTNAPALGNFAAYFDNNGGAGGGWLKAPTNLLTALAGSFTISLWVQTTQVFGNDSDSGISNPGLVSAFNGPGGNWVVPMAITGNKLGFATGGSPQHTLNSTTAITNNSGFVHLVVTRDQNSGQKRIYIDGVLDASGTGSTTALNTPLELNLGYNNGKGLMGAMDEIQIYSGVLSATEVAFLYDNPGSTVPDIGGSPLGEAVDAPQFSWTTGGDADWFPQTDETNDGNDAAQSGAIDHNQSSWIETTVEGPGYFSFYWNVSSDDSDGYDYLEFTIDENYESDISGEWGWDYYEVYLDSDSHTLRWTYYKDDDFTGGQDAAWLDEVTFTPEISVDMTLVIERNNDPNNPGFYAYPSIDYYSPDPITSYEIVSPNGLFACYADGTDNYPIYPTLTTLQEVIDELEAGSWTLYVNRWHPSELQYTFNVTVNQLTLANLTAANITSPTEWQSGIATNHTFTWTGPAGYDSLFLYSYVLETGSASGGFTNLDATYTSTQMPNPLLSDTNGVYINYSLNGFSGVEISDPVDSSFNSLYSWYSQVNLVSAQTRRFEVGSVIPPATPVQILNPLHTGTNFSLSFLTQAGVLHTVEARTNLTTAPWVDLTNFLGDGNLIQLFLPIGPEPETYFRVGTE